MVSSDDADFGFASCTVPEMPEIKKVFSATMENYRRELVPVICVEWTVSDEPL